MSKFYQLKIKKINKNTNNAVIIDFNIPQDLKVFFKFKAGQYITLKTEINSKEIRRDYSICASPISGELKVAVKMIKGGGFSVYANNFLKANTVLEVAPPKGRFVFEPIRSIKRTIVAFAAGSGITPIISILKTVLEEEPLSTFILVYGNKTPRDTIFYSELLLLKSKYPIRFKLEFVFSQSDEENTLFGRIDKNTVEYIVKDKYKNLKLDLFYLCGPETMTTATSEALQKHGIEKDNIHFELFTTSTPIEALKTTTTNENAEITLLLDGKDYSFNMPQKRNILEAALDEDIDVPYSCQAGVCSSCIAILTEGKVNMLQNNILDDRDIDKGLILTCQAKPITSNVILSYDDV
jgi:ring-1,2-phenylacetyl-CoA epoxidase subunit PaaE